MPRRFNITQTRSVSFWVDCGWQDDLVEADVGDLAQVDAAAATGARADVEGGVVCNHLGENV